MEPKKTSLYDIHVEYGGKMVDFAGFYMPIQYSSILEEHRQVRSSVGVFDVSHMGEIEVRGENALEMVNRITINDAAKIQVNQAQYTAICYDDGGIVDDLIVYNRGDHYLLVVNAANTEKDLDWILKHKIDGAEIIDVSANYTQLAVQGVNAEATLQKLTDCALSEIKFYWFAENTLAGVDMIISRTGYTGEPGFEIYFDNTQAEKVWRAIFEAGEEFGIAPIGLGARDSLRLEKKFCLYGNDIDQTTNPYEAGLGWITKLDSGDFIGRDPLQNVKENGPNRRLVGFIVDGKMIPRKGYEVEIDGETVGAVTSGAFSPVLEKNIGLAYVARGHTKVDTEINIVARGRSMPAQIVKMPFVG